MAGERIAKTIKVGTRFRSTATFTALGATTPADPVTVEVHVRAPDGDVTTYTYGVGGDVVRTAQGVYRIDVVPDAAGTWWVRWDASGATLAAVGELAVRVDPVVVEVTP